MLKQHVKNSNTHGHQVKSSNINLHTDE